jgi:uncharacterized protein (TIGR02271 family)
MVEPEPDEPLVLAEEQLQVEKRVVERGRVVVRTHVETREELAEATLRQEGVVVDRVPVGRPVDARPGIREEDGVLVVPIMEERLVLTKQLFVKEELHVRVEARTETFRQPVLLRSERAEVTRAGPADAAAGDLSTDAGEPASVGEEALPTVAGVAGGTQDRG